MVQRMQEVTGKSELISQLAAEYVLGTLRGPARRRFERQLSTDPAVAAQVEFWRIHLNELGRALPAAEVPLEIREALLRRVAPDMPPVSSANRPRHFRSRRRLRRTLLLVASAASIVAAVVLSFMLGQRNPVAPEMPLPQAPTELVQAELGPLPPAEPVVDWLPEPPLPRHMIPVYVAELKIPSSQMRWLVSLSPDHRELSVVAGNDFFQVGRSRLHLWGVTEDNQVHSLGLLPFQRDQTAVFEVPDALRGSQNLRFVLSLESSDSLPSGRPQGQVLWESQALDSI